MFIILVMAHSEDLKVRKTVEWRLAFSGSAGTSRHPSSRQQTIEVCEDVLHVTKATYEPTSEKNGKSSTLI